MRPSRIIETVEIVLSTSFWAVPALRRVDPVITSGPVTATIVWSARRASGESGTPATATTSAPASAAARAAPSAYGVVPLAERTTTASAGVTAASAAAPASLVLRCLVRGDACDDASLLEAERRPALVGVDGGEPAGRARAGIDQSAASLEPLDDGVDRGRELGGGLAHRRRDAHVLVAHQLDELERRAQVEVGVPRVALLRDRSGSRHDRGV